MALSDRLAQFGRSILDLPWFSLALVAAGTLVTLVGLALVWRLVRPRQSKYRPLPEPKPIGQRQNPKEGHCLMIIGRLGSGKTSLAVTRAVKLARAHRIPLYSNAAIRDDATVLRSWADLRAIPTCRTEGVECVNGCHLRPDSDGCSPGVLVLDELHLWYPSLAHLMPKEQQQEAFELLSWARKRGWTVIATTQALTRVSTGYRQLLTELYQVKPISQGLLHRAAMVDPDTGENIISFAAVFSPRRARYNTRAEVRPLWAGQGRQPRPATRPAHAWGQTVEFREHQQL